MYQEGGIFMEVPRTSPITDLLDDVFYKSSIEDMRKFTFNQTRSVKSWLLFSDYYFEDERPNKVITFTAMPYFSDFLELQSLIKSVAPRDVKKTRTINEDFIEIINSLPIMNVVFSFEQKKYFLWDSNDEFKQEIFDYLERLKAYVSYWNRTEPERKKKLAHISKNINCLESLLRRGKKQKLIPPMYLVALLGGYVGSLLCRETSLSSLVWMSDRDSTNEICHNLIRDLFQITLIDIAKKNIQFSFTTSNSSSDEWYEEMTRIPDYLTGAISSFDFEKNLIPKDKFSKMFELHFAYNIKNSFLYRFIADDERIRLQRWLIA